MVYGLRFRLQGLGFRIKGLGFRVEDLGLSIWGSGFRVLDLGRDLGLWVEALGTSPGWKRRARWMTQ